MIAGLRPSGVVAPLAFPGATDNAVMETYVEQALVPQLLPGDVVVWDNLQPHKNAAVIAAINQHVIPLQVPLVTSRRDWPARCVACDGRTRETS